ncbi:S-layer homology domain-containing protein [Paraclostridium sordellii]|uniref:S-layer homology domain-containing protein n=1 Tax=Paraclostridium sordellii TaxID=1505 RepID=UPI0030D03BCD
MKKLRKPTTAMLLAVMIISNAQGLVVYANEKVNESKLEIKDENTQVDELKNLNTNEDGKIEESRDNKSQKVADVTPPVLDVDSLKIDKKEAKPGDRVKLSFKATDDMSNIKKVFVYYDKPITGNTEDIIMKYNDETKLYEGYMEINEKSEEGNWKIDWILLEDEHENSRSIKNIHTNTYGEDLSSGDFNVSETNSDVTAPTLDISSLKVDKKEVKPGDRVKLSFKATDDMSNIKKVFVYYDKPITGNTEDIIMKYNDETKLYEGYMEINEKSEEGNWKIDWILLEDEHENSRSIKNIHTNTYGEDLSSGDFNVSETNSDVTAPILDISSLKVDKKEVKPGDRVKLSFKATDDMSNIKKVFVYYDKPITGNTEDIIMKYNDETKLYEGYMEINEKSEEGNWKIDWILLEDEHKNSRSIKNIHTNTYGEDLSSGDFNVAEDTNTSKPIQGVSIVNQNETWSNKTINGDLYIGPEALLKVSSNVKVTGNVYVLGALKINGGLTIDGTLYGTKMSWGGNPTLNNGTIVMSGSNSIGSTSMSNYPVQDIPVRIDNAPLVATDGKIDIKGATVNVADMYIEGKKVDLDYKGRFDVKDINIGTKNKVTIEFKTVFGNTITKDYDVDNDQAPIVPINKVPEITASDVEIKVGEKFNPLSGVSAKDHEDGDITNNIEVIENTVNTSKAGVYKAVYKVRDSQGASVTKEIKVNVAQGLVGMNRVPEITASDVEIKVGEKFNPLSGVSAKDHEDGDITNKIEVIENTVDTSKAGVYKVVYKVRDSQGATASKTINITVKEKIEFNDTQGHWAEKTINSFVEKGFINGYDDKTFKPDNSMTRAEFVKVINNVFGYNQMGTEQFDDVNESDWFYSDICIGINMGYIKGKSKDKFAPNDSITRQEVAMILTNIMDNKDNNLDKLSLFKDGHQTDEWAKPSVEGAIESGYLNGYEDQTIRANGNITRAEAISMLSRVKK